MFFHICISKHGIVSNIATLAKLEYIIPLFWIKPQEFSVNKYTIFYANFIYETLYFKFGLYYQSFVQIRIESKIALNIVLSMKIL